MNNNKTPEQDARTKYEESILQELVDGINILFEGWAKKNLIPLSCDADEERSVGMTFAASFKSKDDKDAPSVMAVHSGGMKDAMLRVHCIAFEKRLFKGLVRDFIITKSLQHAIGSENLMVLDGDDARDVLNKMQRKEAESHIPPFMYGGKGGEA